MTNVPASDHLSEAGDHVLNPDLAGYITNFDGTDFQKSLVADPLRTGSLRTASVLIPVRNQNGQATLLLTRRTDHLTNHAGQIAFPGGKQDPQDASLIDTALREAEEEIGLERDLVEPLGFLNIYQTFSGYRIAPLLAIIPEDFIAKPDPGEVAEVFDVPLSFLMNPDNYTIGSKIWQDKKRFYHEISYEHYYIWGITAGILHNFYERLYR